jgi:hypothetical protein
MSKYQKKTSLRLQPEILPDGTIAERSLRKGSFKRVLRAYSLYVVECIRTLQPHDTFDVFYLKNVKFEFPTSKVILLYINNKKS